MVCTLLPPPPGFNFTNEMGFVFNEYCHSRIFGNKPYVIEPSVGVVAGRRGDSTETHSQFQGATISTLKRVICIDIVRYLTLHTTHRDIVGSMQNIIGLLLIDQDGNTLPEVGCHLLTSERYVVDNN